MIVTPGLPYSEKNNGMLGLFPTYHLSPSLSLSLSHTHIHTTHISRPRYNSAPQTVQYNMSLFWSSKTRLVESLIAVSLSLGAFLLFLVVVVVVVLISQIPTQVSTVSGDGRRRLCRVRLAHSHINYTHRSYRSYSWLKCSSS
jgi:hypothetical protein